MRRWTFPFSCTRVETSVFVGPTMQLAISAQIHANWSVMRPSPFQLRSESLDSCCNEEGLVDDDLDCFFLNFRNSTIEGKRQHEARSSVLDVD
ncbi:hypothetical protein Y032_0141g2265 [Ancylostoma ceylanicum]|uniref:Uncharacterized protein n=1 Tax=Ancylostoma ceylanicum TaxID=53326 RepID=A0A016T425_9BILA|nr:hypothetical protein Y032_0141g2265 [Ancylostoma ceylanicum]